MLAAAFEYDDIVELLNQQGAERPKVPKPQEFSYESFAAAVKADAVATEARVRAEKEDELRQAVLLESRSKEERISFDTAAKARRHEAERQAKELLRLEEARLRAEQEERQQQQLDEDVEDMLRRYSEDEPNDHPIEAVSIAEIVAEETVSRFCSLN
jgi:uncharacterized membrane protein YheB (UPF0754 family)